MAIVAGRWVVVAFIVITISVTISIPITVIITVIISVILRVGSATPLAQVERVRRSATENEQCCHACPYDEQQPVY